MQEISKDRLNKIWASLFRNEKVRSLYNAIINFDPEDQNSIAVFDREINTFT